MTSLVVNALSTIYQRYEQGKNSLINAISQATGRNEQEVIGLRKKYDDLQKIFEEAQQATTSLQKTKQTYFGIERRLFSLSASHTVTLLVGLAVGTLSMFSDESQEIPWIKELSVVLITVSQVLSLSNTYYSHQDNKEQAANQVKLQFLSKIAKDTMLLNLADSTIREAEYQASTARSKSLEDGEGFSDSFEVPKRLFLAVTRGEARAYDGHYQISLETDPLIES